MRLTQKIRSIFLSLALTLVASVFIAAPKIDAQTPPSCVGAGSPTAIERCSENYIDNEIARRCSSGSADARERCAESTRNSIRSGDYNYDGTPDDQELADNPSPSEAPTDCDEDTDNDGSTIDPDDCRISEYLRTFTNVLIALVGIVVTIMIVVGGIQYSAARDNPQAVQAAKGKITNAMLALLAYIFMSAFLQWIVPGGIL